MISASACVCACMFRKGGGGHQSLVKQYCHILIIFSHIKSLFFFFWTQSLFIFFNWNKTKITALWKLKIKAHHRWWVSPLIQSSGWFWTNPYLIPFFWKISNQTLKISSTKYQALRPPHFEGYQKMKVE